MKKRILTLLVLVTMMTNTTFAKDINVTSEVLAAFTAHFTNASDVAWERSENYYKASFDFYNQHLTAYISEEGVILGVKRNIITFDLPMNLQIALKKKFAGYWVSELFEYSVNGDTIYYMAVENAEQKVILQSAGTANWNIHSKKTK